MPCSLNAPEPIYAALLNPGSMNLSLTSDPDKSQHLPQRTKLSPKRPPIAVLKMPKHYVADKTPVTPLVLTAGIRAAVLCGFVLPCFVAVRDGHLHTALPGRLGS